MIFKLQILAFIALFTLLLPSSVSGNKFNISFSNLVTCQEYDIKSKGYTYADFFKLNVMKNNNLKDNERLHLKFYVMTKMDAHILLSETDKPGKSDRVYEIVLGAGGNSFSTIRAIMSRKRVATTLSPDLLSTFDPMPVEIIQYNDGALVVNIPNFSEPHLNYTDENPLNISYVSFSSYGNVAARWYYDCEFDGFLGEMEMETRPVSNEERLVADLLSKSEPDLPPPRVKEFEFAFKVRSVEYDQRTSILNTRFHLMMRWFDQRLVWNSSEYGNVEKIVRPLFRIWHPTLNIEDGALDTFQKFDPFYSVLIYSNGSVIMLARNAELHSWCFEVTPNWPNDAINCEIILGSKETGVKLLYEALSPMTDTSINELSEWTIDRVGVLYSTYDHVGNKTEFSNNTKAFLQSIEGDLKIRITISRNSAFYHCIFTAPALVAETLILLAFFLKKYRRGGLNLVALLVVSLALMFAAKHAPVIVVPDIVNVYRALMLITTITYLLHVLSIWFELYPPKVPPHEYVMTIINCSAVRFILAMRFEDSSGYIAAQEYPWLELSKILNRISFVIVITAFIFLNCTV